MSHLKPLKYRKLTFSMCLLFVLTFSISFGQGFVTTWKTDNSGTSNNDQITIPVTGNYTINWEEVDNVTNSGTVSASGAHTLTFPNSGIYRVALSGNLAQIQFDGSGDKNKILSIESWGNVSWTSMESAFKGCINLVYNATDIPNLSNVTNCSEMFRSCTVFNGDINSWEVSTITDMSFMFRASGFNKKLSAWDVSNVTTMRFMFKNASAFDRNLGNWNITQVTNMIGMLDGTALLPINYDRTLIGWASQAVQPNIDLGVDGLQYCTGEIARNNLIANKNWTFSADALKPNCNAFITTWKTDNVGSSNNNQITIPGTGSYNITWEEIGNSSNNGTANATDTQTITFPNSGTYYIEITGGLTRINFSNFGDIEKILSIEQWGAPVWTSMENAFSGCKNLVINALDAPNLSGLTNCYQMFRDCTALTGDLSNWNVSNVTIMRAMFRDCTLFTGDLSNWNVSNVVTMRFMFYKCDVFDSDLSNWDVSSVQYFWGTFAGAKKFNSDISAWVLDSATDTRGMFQGAKIFNQDISNWNVSNVENMLAMFELTEDFNQDLSNWNVSNVTDIRGMFARADSFNYDIGNWNVANVHKMSRMFDGAKDFDQNIGGWDIANVTDISNMLKGCAMSQNNYDKTLFGWATQNVQPNLTLGANTLEYCVGEIPRNKLINDKGWSITGDSKVANCEFITTWKTDNTGDSNNNQVIIPGTGNYLVAWENVNDTSINGFTTATGEQTITFPSNGIYNIKMGSDFRKLEFDNFTGDSQKLLTIEQWGNAQWLSMKKAFNGCSNLTYNATDVPDLSQVTNCSDMFTNCISFNGDISNWDVSNVTNMTSMFGFCNAFNQDLSNWTVDNVTNMNFMFGGAKAFNGNISDWTVDNVTNMESLFFNAEKFNRNLDNWNTANVTTMQNMFSGAVDFNQSLETWDVSNVSNMTDMFNNAKLSTVNYDATLLAWSNLASLQSGINFNGGNSQFCASEIPKQNLVNTNNWTITDAGLDAGCGIVLRSKIILQGAAINPNAGEEALMRDDLRVAGLLPTTSPYADEATCNATVFTITGVDAIVDWVWVELRDNVDNTIIVGATSALLTRSGNVVNVNGFSSVNFNQFAGDFHIVVKHRNHLSMMSQLPISLGDLAINVVDFTDANNQITHGVNAQTTFGMPTDKVGMWTGNVNGDTVVQYSGTTPDAPSILSNVLNASGNFLNFPTYVVTGYNVHDVDMNGETQYTGTAPDVPYLLQNVLAHPGNFLNFSTYGIQEQLPEN